MLCRYHDPKTVNQPNAFIPNPDFLGIRIRVFIYIITYHWGPPDRGRVLLACIPSAIKGTAIAETGVPAV